MHEMPTHDVASNEGNCLRFQLCVEQGKNWTSDSPLALRIYRNKITRVYY